jgi:SAM-dependent methyltransferase
LDSEPGTGSKSGDESRRRDASHAGHTVYSPLTLALYDSVVLGISNPLVWRCPTSNILALYNRCVTDNHLDVGVGTGWYLDHCRFPGSAPRLGLLDLNAYSLAAAARRVARYRPEQYRADVLKPLALSAAPFRSIAMTYLLHCLPGTLPEKAAALDHLRPLLAPDGVLFGATLLSVGVERNRAARALARFYNRKGVFSNVDDSLAALGSVLHERFRSVEIDVVGCAALFVAKGGVAGGRP